MNWSAKRAGTYFALLTTTNKLGSALAVGVVLWIVQTWVGFDPRGDNTPEVVDGLLLVYCAAPILAMGIALLPLLNYPVDRDAHALVREQLAAQSEAAGRPA